MPTKSAPPRIRVVVVDDHPDSAASLARLLQVMGCDAVFVTTSSMAMSAILTHKPDIVFLDLEMPPPDGYLIARLIRSNFPSQGIRIVAMSGHGDPQDRIRSRESGFDAHLVKPATADLVAATVSEFFPRDGKQPST